MTTGKRERPRSFADLWESRGTRRPPTTIANPLDGAVAARPLTDAEVSGARGVERSGGIDLSPDGREVAFAWDRDGEVEIYAAPIVCDRIIQLTDGGVRSVAPRWSPDGRWVAFVRDGGRRSLWLVDRDGEHEHEAGPGDEVTLGADGVPHWSADTASPLLASAGVQHLPGSARWSRDGSMIAFTAVVAGTTKVGFAHVRGGAVARSEILGGTPFGDSDPVWRPDGRGVVYRRSEHGSVTLHRVFTISHADDAVLDVPGRVVAHAVAPDSETLVALLVDERGANVVVRPKGGIELIRIT